MVKLIEELVDCGKFSSEKELICWKTEFECHEDCDEMVEKFKIKESKL